MKANRIKHIAPNTTQQGFISIDSLGNCTICKLSLVALILLSFLVVNPQLPPKQGAYYSADTLEQKLQDTVHFGRNIQDTLKKNTSTSPAVLRH